MKFTEWQEQAAYMAYAAYGESLALPWESLTNAERDKWREIARTVLGEGVIEFRPSPDFAEEDTRRENETLRKMALDATDDAGKYREAATVLRQTITKVERLRDEAESKLAGMRRAYGHACEQRDKYARRVVEWREVAQNDKLHGQAQWLVDEVGRAHIRECPVEQCDTCSGILGIEESLKVLADE
jgi:hypothetical protein